METRLDMEYSSSASAATIPKAQTTCNWLCVDFVLVAWNVCGLYVCWTLDWSIPDPTSFSKYLMTLFSECSIEISLFTLYSLCNSIFSLRGKLLSASCSLKADFLSKRFSRFIPSPNQMKIFSIHHSLPILLQKIVISLIWTFH